MIKTVVSTITVILSILPTSLDEIRVFSQDQFCPFWDQFCGFAYIIRLGDHFYGRTILPFKISIFFQNFYVPPGFNGLQNKIETRRPRGDYLGTALSQK